MGLTDGFETKNEPAQICDYEGSDYQASFWDSGQRAYEDRVEALALRRLLPRGGRLLLELGAGAGRNTLRYSGFEKIVLVDYSRTQLEQARARLGSSERFLYVAADVNRLPFVSGLFEAATMIRVLHHLPAAPLALQQVRRALFAGAIFILEFANKQNLKAILRYLLSRQEWSPFSLDAVEFAPMNFDFHPRAVRAWLTQSGFAVERQLTVSHFRIGLLKRFVPLSVLVGMDGLLQLTGNWGQFSPSVFARCRAVGGAGRAAPGSFFQCTACGSDSLDQETERMSCRSCGSHWAKQDGIYDFRRPVGS